MANRRADQLPLATDLVGTDILFIEQDPSVAQHPRQVSMQALASYFSDASRPSIEFNIKNYGARTSLIDNTQKVLDTITACVSAGGGIITMPPQPEGEQYKLDGRVLIPTGVNLQGRGPDVSRFLCTDASAGLTFGPDNAGSYGGQSHGFMVDGGYLATRPLVINERVMCKFSNFRSWYAAGTADDGVCLYIFGTQNSLFEAFWVHDGGVVCRFDGGAANNLLLKGEISLGRKTHLEFRNAVTPPPGQLPYPFYNHLISTILEGTEATTEHMVDHQAGALNTMRNCPVYVNGHFGGLPPYLPTGMSSAVRVAIDESAQSQMRLIDCDFAGYDAPSVAMIRAEVGAEVQLDGGSFQGVASPAHALKGRIKVGRWPWMISSVDLPTDLTDPPALAPQSERGTLHTDLMASSANIVQGAFVNGDTSYRYYDDGTGTRRAGSGVAVVDTSWGRSAAGVFAVGNSLAVSGVTGANAVAARYAGQTASGAPTSGTFAIGDWIVTRDGAQFVCTAPGSPGTWIRTGSGRNLGYASSSAMQVTSGTTVLDITGLTLTFTVTDRPVLIRADIPYTLGSATAVYDIRITDNAGTVQQRSRAVYGVAFPIPLRCQERISTPGTYTRKVNVVQVSGTGFLTVNLDTTTTASLSVVER